MSMGENWYNQIIDDVEKELETNAENGLTRRTSRGQKG